MKRITWSLILALGAPALAAAQSVEWSIAPAVLVDAEFSDGPISGPAVELAAVLAPGRLVSYGLAVGLARTDFPVGADELHRNFATAALGVRMMTRGVRVPFGVTLGVGVVVWDDISETDPDFRNSTHAEESLVPGLEVRLGLGESWGLTAFARDHVTGWLNTLIDPAEGNLGHRFVLGAGVYFR